MLVGREVEQTQLRALLDSARAGRSGALVVHGPPGAGKSALLADLEATAASGTRVLRAVGFEGEAAFAHAVLGELLGPVLDLRSELPPVQAAALGAALALEPGEVTAFAVAAATLSLLAAAAEREPLLVVVDDAQWIDEASRAALLFAARRLDREGVALAVGLRDDEDVDPAGLGLPTLALAGLPEAAAQQLLDAAGLAPAVARRLAELTQGNPLALNEIPPLLTPAQRGGTEPLEDPLPLGPALDRAFRRRLDALRPPTRRALVVAACAGEASADSVRAALVGSDADPSALAAAEDAEVIRLDGRRLVFGHPLQRAAVLRAAAPSERRAAHRALAVVLPVGSASRAWHLAEGTEGADAQAASGLAAAAADARQRGAPEEAARAYARAADLEPDDEARAGLLLAAADASYLAGRMTEAAALAGRGAELTQDELCRADLRTTAARAELRAGLATGGRELLVREAKRVRALDPVRAVHFLLEAAVVDMTSGQLRRMLAVAEQAAQIAQPVASPLAFLAGVLIADAQLALGETEAGDAALEEAAGILGAFHVGAGPPPLVAMAAQASLWAERFDRAEAIFDRLVAALREASVVGELVYPLAARSHLSYRLGRWPAALADSAEAVRLGEATGQELAMAHALGALAEIEAALGHDDDARRHAERCLALAQAQGADATAQYGHGALTLLALGRGEPEEAVAHGFAAERAEARTDNDEPGIVRFPADLIEALWRLGREDEALARIERLERQAERPGHTWTQAVALRGRGLLAHPDEADDHFAAALALHDQTPQPFEAARTRLLHGERLRRDRRRSDARAPLRGALAGFERLGAVRWAERARAELRATGGEEAQAPAAGLAPGRPSPAVAELTPQELQIALHAARGMTNREVGAALFLAPKTVEHHLSRSFRKLGIRRRVELAGALAVA